MDAITYSHFRSQLSGVLDKVNDDHKPILITRQNGRPAVVMSLEDFQAYEETAYLMASPKNAERLNQSIEEIKPTLIPTAFALHGSNGPTHLAPLQVVESNHPVDPHCATFFQRLDRRQIYYRKRVYCSRR